MIIYVTAFVIVLLFAWFLLTTNSKAESVSTPSAESADEWESREKREETMKRARVFMEEVRRRRREAGIIEEISPIDEDDNEDVDDDEDVDLLNDKKNESPYAKALGLGIGIGIVSGITGHHIGIGGHNYNG